MSEQVRHVWLDCDPGHDDATAILLAIHLPGLKLLGVSTVHGNASADCTRKNAARCLHAFGAPPGVLVYPGATKPLIRPAKADPEIHGVDGLGGVEGLPRPDSDHVRVRLGPDYDIRRAVEGIAKAIQDTWQSGSGHKVTVISTGPMTNIALFISVYPDLLLGVEQFVFMGGGVGVGNRSAVAEYNILCDPEAAQIVLDAPVPKTMVPLNVSHTAIVTRHVWSQLLSPATTPSDHLPEPTTSLRHTLSTLIGFFAESYRSTFGFQNGPPLHDALTVAYVARPDLFTSKRYRVDIELAGAHTSGETVVDIWNYRTCDDSWGASGKNCVVTESLDVNAFFELFLNCVSKCDKVSPLNDNQCELCLPQNHISTIADTIRGHRMQVIPIDKRVLGREHRNVNHS